MKKHLKITALLLVLALVLAGCNTPSADSGTDATPTSSASSSTSTTTSSPTATPTQAASIAVDYVSVDASDPEEVNVTDPEDSSLEATEAFTITTEDGTYSQDGSVYTITAEGEYTLSGKLSGNIIISADEDAKVTIILNGVTITSSDAAPIYAASASKVTIKVTDGTYNVITDSRAANDGTEATEDTAANTSGAISAKCDMTISGFGTLIVTGSYKDGIHSSKDLTIKGATLKVTAYDNAIKGKDSVTLKELTAILISTGGDGIKTEDSDISDSGNQRGIIEISGGNIDIYAACDGISASYDVLVTNDPVLNIYTASYSNYTGSKAASGGTEFYIVAASSLYSTSYTFYAYYYNDDYSDGVWKQGTYSTMVTGGRTRYYGMVLSAPSGYTNVQFFIFNASSTPSTTDYYAATTGDTVNTSMNAYLLSSLSGTTLSGDWVSLSTSSSNNSSKTTYSTKGIKASNSITIESGTIYIYCKDDAIHANSDTVLDTGSYGAGVVTISGGSVVVTAADDGIHADSTVNINNGYVHVITAYEGIEGNQIIINGGYTIVYATDDGLNACSGSATPCITVTGGYTDVTTPSGDTDAIDSNGYYKQSGGFVFVKGGASSGSVAGSIDVDNTITVTGGATIAFGGICESPQNSVNAYVSSGTSCAAGTYVLSDSNGNVILQVTLPSTYSSVWVASELLTTGSTYTLTRDGSSLLSWTQTSGTMGASSSGWGGFGGGGRR